MIAGVDETAKQDDVLPALMQRHALDHAMFVPAAQQGFVFQMIRLCRSMAPITAKIMPR